MSFNLLSRKRDLQSYTNWGNLGYWEEGQCSYERAAESLARRIADMVNLQPSDRLLSVGTGFGEEVRFWHQEYGVRNVRGVEPDGIAFLEAKKLVTDLTEVSLLHGSHLDLEYCWSFDKVIVLDAAYHFKRKSDFFKRISDYMSEGRQICLSDVVLPDKLRLPIGGTSQSPLNISSHKYKLLKVCSKIMAIPTENWMNISDYDRSLRDVGLYIKHFDILTEEVLGGFVSFVKNGVGCRKRLFDRHGKIKSIATAQMIHFLRKSIGIQYVMMDIRALPKELR